MKASKWTLNLVMIALAATPAIAQTRDPAKLSADFPVPTWPANGVVPADLKTHMVFVDLTKNEYIVAFPENLAAKDFEKDGPGQRQVLRYPLQTAVDPKVSVAVTPSTAGKYKYAYTIADGNGAKQSIDQWTLVLPEPAAASAIKQPAGWFGIIQKGRTFKVLNTDWIKGGNAAVWSFEKPEEQIQPGDKKAGFELESDLKPGFTLGYFRMAESTDAVVATSGNIPSLVVQNATAAVPPPVAGAAGGGGGGGFGGGGAPAGATTAWAPVKDDIDKLLSVEYNSKTLPAIAPKFDKTATDKAIASDFMQGIGTLNKLGVLPDSAFVKGTLSDLDTYVKAGGTGQIKPSAQPSGPAEMEVYNAMKISLHF